MPAGPILPTSYYTNHRQWGMLSTACAVHMHPHLPGHQYLLHFHLYPRPKTQDPWLMHVHMPAPGLWYWGEECYGEWERKWNWSLKRLDHTHRTVVPSSVTSSFQQWYHTLNHTGGRPVVFRTRIGIFEYLHYQYGTTWLLLTLCTCEVHCTCTWVDQCTCAYICIIHVQVHAHIHTILHHITNVHVHVYMYQLT